MLCCVSYSSAHGLIRFERELEALRKELAEASRSSSGRSSPTDMSRSGSDDALSSLNSSPILVGKELLDSTSGETKKEK